MAVSVRQIPGEELPQLEARLGEILASCVAGGASVSFLLPFGAEDGARFYEGLRADFLAKKRVLLGAFLEGRLVGSVQLLLDLPPNQPHRAEVAKLLVDPLARGQGAAAALMLALEAAAREAGKTLLVLDTAQGDTAERLYRRLGYEEAGVIPDYALYPDGRFCATVVFYKRL